MTLGTVLRLRRFPVKSMGGEDLPALEIDGRAVRHDREWAVRGDRGKLGSGKNSRRFQRIDGLAECTARRRDGTTVITLPDGTECPADDPGVHRLLTAWLGEPVVLHREEAESHFDDGPVHAVTEHAIADIRRRTGVGIDPLRLRANILIGDVDQRAAAAWNRPGATMRIGDEVLLEDIRPMRRCVMVTNAVGTLPHDPAVLRAIASGAGLTLGVFATVRHTGRIRVGDPVVVADGPPPPGSRVAASLMIPRKQRKTAEVRH